MSTVLRARSIKPLEGSRLDEVDRNIIQQLSHKFADLIEKGTNGPKAKRLAANGSEANGMVGGDN